MAMLRQLTGHLVLNWFDDMTVEQTSCFKLLDGYSRSQHDCFLAEMFPDAAGTNYTLCFRPTGGSKDSPAQSTNARTAAFESRSQVVDRPGSRQAATEEIVTRPSVI